MSLDERVRELAAHVPPPPQGDVERVRARGLRRRRVRRVGVGAGSAVTLAAVIAMGVNLGDGGPTVPPITDAPDAGVEQAPDAGAVDAHWPIELRYFSREDRQHLLRFRGNSWADWSVEVEEPDGSWRLVDREHPGEDFETEGGAFLDEGVTDEEEFLRGVSASLNSGWRNATGLPERVVVDLDDIPGAGELVARLGLDAGEVEAYVSPNVVGCEAALADCVPEGENGARGIAHLPTGFPLFAEESWEGHVNVWLEAEAIRWADPTIAPVPVESIPRQSQSDVRIEPDPEQPNR